MIDNLDVRSEYAYLRVMGDEYAMVIPYTLSAQNLIYGRSVAVMTQFRDAHGFQGNVTQAIELGPDMWEEAVVPIPLEVYEALSSGPQELSAIVTLMFLDCSNTATDVWGWNP
jgi:hypothetical protein